MRKTSSGPEDYRDLIISLYEAALDAECWPNTLDQACSFLDARLIWYMAMDPKKGKAPIWAALHTKDPNEQTRFEEEERAFFERYRTRDTNPFLATMWITPRCS